MKFMNLGELDCLMTGQPASPNLPQKQGFNKALVFRETKGQHTLTKAFFPGR